MKSALYTVFVTHVFFAYEQFVTLPLHHRKYVEVYVAEFGELNERGPACAKAKVLPHLFRLNMAPLIIRSIVKAVIAQYETI